MEKAIIRNEAHFIFEECHSKLLLIASHNIIFPVEIEVHAANNERPWHVGGLYTELFYAIIPTFGLLLFLHCVTFCLCHLLSLNL